MSISTRMLLIAFIALLVPHIAQAAFPKRGVSVDQKYFSEADFYDVTTPSAAGLQSAIALATPHTQAAIIFDPADVVSVCHEMPSTQRPATAADVAPAPAPVNQPAVQAAGSNQQNALAFDLKETVEHRFESGHVVIVRKIDDMLTQACSSGDGNIQRVQALLKAGANPDNLGSVGYYGGCICNALGATLAYRGRCDSEAPLIAILAKAGAKDFSGTGWVNLRPSHLYVGKKEATQALKAAGVHPRIVAFKNALIEKFPKELGEIIVAYIPHQEDISDAIMQADEKGLKEYMAEPGFDANAVCLTGKTPLYTFASASVNRLSLDIEHYDFTSKAIAQLRAAGANPDLAIDGKKSPIALMEDKINELKATLKKLKAEYQAYYYPRGFCGSDEDFYREVRYQDKRKSTQERYAILNRFDRPMSKIERNMGLHLEQLNLLKGLPRYHRLAINNDSQCCVIS